MYHRRLKTGGQSFWEGWLCTMMYLLKHAFMGRFAFCVDTEYKKGLYVYIRNYGRLVDKKKSVNLSPICRSSTFFFKDDLVCTIRHGRDIAYRSSEPFFHPCASNPCMRYPAYA